MNEKDYIWKKMTSELLTISSEVVSEMHTAGFEALNLPQNHAPSIAEINEILKEKTDWQVYEAEGYVTYDEFFDRILKYEFPVNAHQRPMHEIYHASAPDKFHDVFGHLPFLYNNDYTKAVQAIGEIGMRYREAEHLKKYIERYYFHIFEYGLIRENGVIKVFGSGIASSFSEGKDCLSKPYKHYPHNPIIILETDFEIDETIKQQYFVLDGLNDIMEAQEIMIDYIRFMDSRKTVYPNGSSLSTSQEHLYSNNS